MNQETIERAARALYADINPGHAKGKGWDDVMPRWQESYRSNARAVIAAIHPTVSVWEDTDDGWFYEGSKDDEFPMSRPICRRPVVDPEYLRKQAAQFLAVAVAIEGGAA